MKRQIITIDEEKCDGCGACVTGCKEGALQIIDGKARLLSETYCDGLGACLGECPRGAISIEEREADPYSEAAVMEKLIRQPREIIAAHLDHLAGHGEKEYHAEALRFLEENDIQYSAEEVSPNHGVHEKMQCGCPGSAAREIRRSGGAPGPSGRAESMLGQWPVQLHLVSPAAPYFKNAELVVMSTCAPLASANVHADYLAGRAVVVACPKLDVTDPYINKLAEIFRINNTNRAIIVRMEVPCCGGLTRIAAVAAGQSGREGLTVEEHVLSVQGELINKTIVFKN